MFFFNVRLLLFARRVRTLHAVLERVLPCIDRVKNVYQESKKRNQESKKKKCCSMWYIKKLYFFFLFWTSFEQCARPSSAVSDFVQFWEVTDEFWRDVAYVHRGRYTGLPYRICTANACRYGPTTVVSATTWNDGGNAFGAKPRDCSRKSLASHVWKTTRFPGFEPPETKSNRHGYFNGNNDRVEVRVRSPDLCVTDNCRNPLASHRFCGICYALFSPKHYATATRSCDSVGCNRI